MNFQPGEPNLGNQSSCFAKWEDHSILAYCSGNNLIVLTKLLGDLQTLYCETDLICVDINANNGFIAVASQSRVYVYKPFDLVSSNRSVHLNWQIFNEYAPEDKSQVTSLSWGNDNELVVGTLSQLSLLKIQDSLKVIWQQVLPSACYLVRFSQNSELIASISQCDKFINFFYRTNFNEANTQFDLICLKHSSYVIDFKFRIIASGTEHYNILYSISNDNYLRVFLSFEFQSSKKIQHWGSLQLGSGRKFVKVIDHYFFEYMIGRSVERLEKGNGLSQSLQKQISKLVELQSDLIMVVDMKGLVNFYLVNNLNLNPPKAIKFKCINSEPMEFPPHLFPSEPKYVSMSECVKIYIKLKDSKVTFANYKEIQSIQSGELSTNGDIAFAIQDLQKRNIRLVFLKLDGLLVDLNYQDLFQDMSEGQELRRSITNLSMKEEKPIIDSHVKQKCHYIDSVLGNKLTGHKKSIQKVFKDQTGEVVLTISRFNEHKLWQPLFLHKGCTLQQKCTLNTETPIIDAIIMRKGEVIVCYTIDHKLLMWNTKNLRVAKKTCEYSIQDVEKSVCWFHVPEYQDDYNSEIHRIVGIYKHGQGYLAKSWKVDLERHTIETLDVAELPLDEPIVRISPVDPVGISLASRSRDILTAITSNGTLKSFSIKVTKTKLDWITNCTIKTNITDASYIKGSSINKIAVSKHNKVYIFNTRYAMLEYSEEFGASDEIVDIDWANMSCNMEINSRNKGYVLSIGFKHCLILYSELNFDYTNNLPSFAPIKKIDLSKYTSHAINDSIWLNRGLLVVGCGNQLFINENYTKNSLTPQMIEEDNFTKKIIGDRSLSSNLFNSIFNLVKVLNSTLPVYHPQLVIQCIYFGKIGLVKNIFMSLLSHLETLEDAEDDESFLGKNNIKNLSMDLAIKIEEFCEPQKYEFVKYNEKITRLKEKLMAISLPVLTRHQQSTLLTIIESLDSIDKYITGTTNYNGCDNNGVNFFLGFRLFQSHIKTQTRLHMRDVLFGYFSENQQLLLSYVATNLNWNRAYKLGLVFWLEHDLLVSQFEIIANNEFQNSSEPPESKYFESYKNNRNPINCTLFNLALRKLSKVAKLWKISYGHPEQQKMIKFLLQDFSLQKVKLSAEKNAFSLLSKHRFYLAACFFLLADRLKDCCNVLVKQCKDISLAIGVARVYEPSGETLTELLLTHLLPGVLTEGDRWLNIYIFLVLRQPRVALLAMTKSPYEIINMAKLEEYFDDKNLYTKTMKVVKDQQVIETYDISITNNSIFLKNDPILVILYKSLREKLASQGVDLLAQFGSHEVSYVKRISMIYSRMGCDYLSLDLLRNWQFIQPQRKKITAKTDVPEFNLDAFKAPPPATAFAEPDMSAFDFGM